MTTFLKVKNRAVSNLASDVSSGDTAWTVTTGEGVKFPSAYPFHVTCENEIVECTGRAGDVFTVTRAQEETTASPHIAGSDVQLRITAAIVKQLQDHELLSIGVHGVGESPVCSEAQADAKITTHQEAPHAHHTKFTITDHDIPDRHPLDVLDPLVCSADEAIALIAAHTTPSAHHQAITPAQVDDKILTHKDDPTAHQTNLAGLPFIIDNGDMVIATGQKGHLEIPFACTINRVTMLSDQPGSIVVDIWKNTYANSPPTDADSITASSPPTLSAAQKSQDSTLTGWTKAILAGDILAYTVDSCTTIKRVLISLNVTKS